MFVFSRQQQVMVKSGWQGSLVRAFRRIEELLRQLVAAVRVIGDQELAAKFEEASESIKRGVVFAASLYL